MIHLFASGYLRACIRFTKKLICVFSCLLLLTGLQTVYASEEKPASFVGSEQCRTCHSAQFNSWKDSHHRHAFEDASIETILGDCDDRELVFHDIKTHFFTRGERCFVNTQDEKSEYRDFEIRYTLGYYPLQQYLLELGEGHIQALNVAWDSRGKEEGGQRWFHLQADEEIIIDHPFHWARHYQNWNSRCAQCHVTGFKKQYEEDRHAYNSTWAENAVTCESCHGPASRHLELAMRGYFPDKADLGFEIELPAAGSFVFVEDAPIAISKNSKEDIHKASSQLLNQCGSCHSRRESMGDILPNSSYHDGHRLSLLEPGLYFADGQIRDEVFVFGSFLQSKMHAAGVNCLNCHDPHSGETLAKGNALCLQCHKPDVFDTPKHHHHVQGATGSDCVDCHMPERTYMQVDDRRDHKFVVPHPLPSEVNESLPSPCLQCHQHESHQWVNDKLASWGVEPLPASHWSVIHAGLRQFDDSYADDLLGLLAENSLPALVRATLASYLPSTSEPAPASVLAKLAGHENPLVRLSAINTLPSLQENISKDLWQTLINDPVASVRHEAALLRPLDPITGLPLSLSTEAIEETVSRLVYNADSPAGLSQLASFYISLGRYEEAEKSFLEALKIEPHFLPARLNYADFLRASDRDEAAGRQLRKAVSLAPDSAAASHSLGLYLVRKGDYETALHYFAESMKQADATPRYAYVYAVALATVKGKVEAVESLQINLERWPSNAQLLSAMVLYLQQQNRFMEAMVYQKRLQVLGVQ